MKTWKWLCFSALIFSVVLLAAVPLAAQVVVPEKPTAPPPKASKPARKPAASNPAPASSAPGSLLLEAGEACTVSVDGQPQGTLGGEEMKTIELRRGQHVVKAVSAAGQRVWRREVEIQAGVQRFLRIEFESAAPVKPAAQPATVPAQPTELVIDSDVNAFLDVDGERFPLTSKHVNKITAKPGNFLLQVRDGVGDVWWSETRRIESGAKQIIQLRLKDAVNARVGALLEEYYRAKKEKQPTESVPGRLGRLLDMGGSLDIVLNGVYRSGLESRSVNKETFLHCAAYEGDLELTRLLLDCGANVNDRNSANITPLHYAALKGHTAIAALLLDKGAAVNARAGGFIMLSIGYANYTFHEPVQLATATGNIELVRLLVGRGARLRDDLNLFGACRSGNIELVRWVLDSLTPPLNPKALDYAFQGKNYAVQGKHEAIIQLLVEKGMPINSTHLLHRATEANMRVLVPFLLNKGADINLKASDEETPLHIAACQGNIDLVKLLISRGASKSMRNRYKATPRDVAKSCARREFRDVNEELLKLL